MPLTLKNFTNRIDPTILERGRRYFLDGQVMHLEEIDEAVWSAEVTGTEDYKVEIEKTSEGTLSYSCTCPYDWGPTCKHVAAVLFAIEESLSGPGVAETQPGNPTKPAQKPKTRREKVADALRNRSREELAEFLAEIARDDRQVAGLILARFSDRGEGKQAYVGMVEDALRAGEGKYGYIDYEGVRRVTGLIYKLLDHADIDLQQGRFNSAIPAFQAVIETVVPAIEQADDSNGELGYCINTAVEKLAEAAALLPPDDRPALFDYCLAEAASERYHGWDWGWELAHIAADMVTTAEERTRLFAALDKMGARRQAKEHHLNFLSNFDYEQAAKIKFSVIQRLDDDQAVLAFLDEHADIEQFFIWLVEFHIEHGDLKLARELCDQKLKESDPRQRSNQWGFLELLLRISKLENNPAEVAQLTEALFWIGGDFGYYDSLKQVTDPNQWPTLVNRLLAEAQTHPYRDRILPEIYVRETMWPQLLDFIRHANSYLVNQYRQPLESHFPAEMCAVYERLIWHTLDAKVNRQGYQEACRYLRRIRKLGQEERVEQLTTQIQAKYPRRRALLDELSKL